MLRHTAWLTFAVLCSPALLIGQQQDSVSITEDRIMYVKMQYMARRVFHTAWEIANREEHLKLDVGHNAQ